MNNQAKHKHTEGPWTIDANGDIISGQGAIAWLPDQAERPKRNAHLIAAAPELLEAVCACLPDLEHYAATHGPGPDRRLSNLVDVIAKAIGEAAQ